METYVISDLHLGHRNILSYDNRPFKDLDEMDTTIIGKLYATLGSSDHLYMLGDISYYDRQTTFDIIASIPGHKHLIIGNHDQKFMSVDGWGTNHDTPFDEIFPYMELHRNKYAIVLSHYPIPSYKNARHGWKHLYGHVHNSEEHTIIENTFQQFKGIAGQQHYKHCNIGCMMPYMNYAPININDICWI